MARAGEPWAYPSSVPWFPHLVELRAAKGMLPSARRGCQLQHGTGLTASSPTARRETKGAWEFTQETCGTQRPPAWDSGYVGRLALALCKMQFPTPVGLPPEQQGVLLRSHLSTLVAAVISPLLLIMLAPPILKLHQKPNSKG